MSSPNNDYRFGCGRENETFVSILAAVESRRKELKTPNMILSFLRWRDLNFHIDVLSKTLHLNQENRRMEEICCDKLWFKCKMGLQPPASYLGCEAQRPLISFLIRTLVGELIGKIFTLKHKFEIYCEIFCEKKKSCIRSAASIKLDWKFKKNSKTLQSP